MCVPILRYKLGARQAIIAVENGKYEPGLSLALRIARAFGKSVEEQCKLLAPILQHQHSGGTLPTLQDR